MTEREHGLSQAKDAPPWVPAEVDMTRPSVARMYDYYLGGKDNYPVDQEASQQLAAAAPSTPALAVNNRRFLQRAVRYLAAEEGIEQFLDHGSGLPTQDNVHQIAQRFNPRAQVVYVDNDPIVLAHGRALLADNDRTTVITADMRDTEDIRNHPDVQRLLDFEQPVGILFVSVLHCIPDSDDPAGLFHRIVDHAAPGSCVVFSHLVSSEPAAREELTNFMLEATGGDWGRVRAPEEVTPWLEGLELVSPGLVEASAWRPDPEGETQESLEWIELSGVARKPTR